MKERGGLGRRRWACSAGGRSGAERKDDAIWVLARAGGRARRVVGDWRKCRVGG